MACMSTQLLFIVPLWLAVGAEVIELTDENFSGDSPHSRAILLYSFTFTATAPALMVTHWIASIVPNVCPQRRWTASRGHSSSSMHRGVVRHIGPCRAPPHRPMSSIRPMRSCDRTLQKARAEMDGARQGGCKDNGRQDDRGQDGRDGTQENGREHGGLGLPHARDVPFQGARAKSSQDGFAMMGRPMAMKFRSCRRSH